MQSLKGKTVVVTGASSGIGRAAARAFAAQGMQLVLTARSEESLNALAKELGPSAHVIPADLNLPSDVDRLCTDCVAKLSHIDVLFANAGVFEMGSVAEGNPKDWDELMMINVNSVFRMIHAFLPGMIERKSGDILVTGSIAAHHAMRGEPIYAASKHALRAFLQALRLQVATDNIRVGSISPGTVLNALWGIHTEEEISQRVNDHSGLRSEDIAETAVFVLSRSPHITIRDIVILPQAWDEV